MPLGQLWPAGPIYSLYAAYIQPICSLYTAHIHEGAQDLFGVLAGAKAAWTPVDKAVGVKPLEAKLISAPPAADSLARRSDGPAPMKRAISPVLSARSILASESILLLRASPEAANHGI